MVRRFNKRQKMLAYLQAEGKCQTCGAVLQPAWHADHVIPYSLGGETELDNLQALCPKCNQKKGNKMNQTITLRAWQIEAQTAWRKMNKRDFLCIATPGAGKTTFALSLAYEQLYADKASLVIIVCPTDHIKHQWAKRAHELGMDITPKWESATWLSPDFMGMAITYQQLSMSADIVQQIVNRRNVFVILDEIHHAGDDSTWGRKITNAFQNATYRLALSGTPFRTDNQQIPYVYYDDNGLSHGDYVYSLSAAITEGVCRSVFFPSFGGVMEWWSKDGEYMKATFQDSVSKSAKSERLRTALDANGDWFKQVFREANEKLLYIRTNTIAPHPDAGGLVLAKDQQHAQQLAAQIEKMTGEKPTLVISDIDNATQEIENFAKTKRKWIVAVRMVSEGVDIPRLRVLVYATNVLAELSFRQAVGRVIRMTPNIDTQEAYVYIPAESDLLLIAKQIRDERQHALKELDKRDRESAEQNVMFSQYQAVSSEASEHVTIFDSDEFSVAEKTEARALLREMGFGEAAVEMAARIIRRTRQTATHNTPPVKTALDDKPLYNQKDILKKRVTRLVGQVAGMTGLEHKDVHFAWLKRGGMKQSEATLDDLKAKIEWLENWIKDLNGD